MKLFQEDKLIVMTLVAAPLFRGLYFYHENYFVATVLLVILFLYLLKYRCFCLDRSMYHGCIIGILLVSFLSVSYAVDSGMAFLGFLKILTVYLFYSVISQSHGEKKEQYLKSVAYSGIVLAVIGVLSVFITPLRDLVIQNGRLGSMFQYANMNALWMISSFVILAFETHIKKWERYGMILLWIAMMLTFSRSLYFLGFLFVGLCYYLSKNNRKIIATTFLIGLILGIIIISISSISEASQRIQETSFKVSEWQTRLLYYKDGLRLALKNPLGLGHLGYYYLQRQYQSAVYYIKFIHNGFLQLWLDSGIISMVLFLLIGTGVFLTKKSREREKVLIALIYGHALIDFDLQFSVTLFLIVLLLPYDTIKFSLNKFAFYLNCIIITMGIAMYAYMGIATYSAYLGNSQFATFLYPKYTEAYKESMLGIYDLDLEEAYHLSRRIQRLNPNVVEIYTVQKDWYLEVDQEDKAVQRVQEAMKIYPLNMSYIEEYSKLLISAAEKYLLQADTEEAKKYLIALTQIPNYIEEIKMTIDPKAYFIQHTPKLEVTPFMMKSVQWANEQLNEMR